MSSFFPGWTSLSSCIFILICDFKDSFSCSIPEVESKISAITAGLCYQTRAAVSNAELFRKRIPAAQPWRRVLHLWSRNVPSCQEQDKDQMGKWHCRDTQSREEEESIAGRSKATNMLADMKHEPVLVDPAPPDLLKRSLGTKLLTSAGPEYTH